jgi:hypothetical protein
MAEGSLVQDNFVSHTMKAEEEANLARINEQKSKADVANPLEPLIISLLKGFIDDADLSTKLQALYKVPRPSCFRCGLCATADALPCFLAYVLGAGVDLLGHKRADGAWTMATKLGACAAADGK